jgi:hypothetical protein
VDLKLITAASVFLALVFPQGLAIVKGSLSRPASREDRYARD